MEFICTTDVVVDKESKCIMEDLYESIENIHGDIFFHDLMFSKKESGIIINTYDPRKIFAYVFSIVGDKYGCKSDGTLKVFSTAQSALHEIKRFHLGLDEDIEFGLIRDVTVDMFIKKEKRFYV